jgi:hypothetical protein
MKGWIIAILVIATILAVIAVFLFIKKPKQTSKVIPQSKQVSLEDLMDIVKNPNSTKDDILKALKLFNNYFVIDAKDSHRYFIFLIKALTHKNVDKEIFNYFHNEIKKRNQKFKRELELLEMKALG